MTKVRVGISVGDINGIGLEVIIKSLSHPKIVELCTPVIYGSSKVLSYHKNIVRPQEFNYQNLSNAQNLTEDRINLINCWNEDVMINLGVPSEESGKFAYISLDQATQDLRQGLIDVLVTAPIDKHAMSLAGFPATGHTEYLTEQFNVAESLMLMVSDDLRIGVVTNHLPLKDVASHITQERIQEKALLLHKSLQMDFGIEKPMIAILGLNPHAGDQGLIGHEEEEIIRPAINNLKNQGLLIGGPYAADGFFGSSHYREVDGILAMYHDQGLVPFKALSFGKGINFTAGLPVVRTSPDHGTGATIAGQNIADESSFLRSIYLAIDIFRSRSEYHDAHKNRLKMGTLKEEEEGEDIPEEFSE
ncbi:MAG: 4-hydroxythreonine-4-phosphate dehydrogenase PdxA [Saprospiraceae bacterium]|nr:4-hydroxythreonine-4-phosphate dehydrogenase PdxA [Saprospiraceae bacterium]